MANDDVGLKLCQQHVIKLDFEIKAVIQVCRIVLSLAVPFMPLPYTNRLKRLRLPTLKYRKLRADIIEVFKTVSYTHLTLPTTPYV